MMVFIDEVIEGKYGDHSAITGYNHIIICYTTWPVATMS